MYLENLKVYLLTQVCLRNKELNSLFLTKLKIIELSFHLYDFILKNDICFYFLPFKMLCFFSCVTVIVKKDELGSIGPKQIVRWL